MMFPLFMISDQNFVGIYDNYACCMARPSYYPWFDRTATLALLQDTERKSDKIWIMGHFRNLVKPKLRLT
jgi:hypothetical protein